MTSAQVALAAAGTGAVLLAASGPGVRLQAWPYPVGLGMVLVAGLAGLVGLAAAGQTLAAVRSASPLPWLALAAAAVSLAVVAVPAWWIARAVSTPVVNDVATDPAAPLPLPGHGVAAAGAAGVAPLTLDLDPADAFARAVRVADALGWSLAARDAAGLSFHATVATPWFGFVDDVAVRVRAEGAGARVDVRSASRVGLSDLGTNARRIRAYLAALAATEGP